MEYKNLLYKIYGRHSEIQLHRPDFKNALNPELITELKNLLNHLVHNDEILSITITGSNKVFCSGADLSHLQSLRNKTFEEHLSDSNHLAELLYMIFTYPKPVIAKVFGPALAGGCGLVTVCDFALAEEQAVFGYPEVKVGFIPALVSVFLIKMVGERRAREMLLLGKKYSASDAYNYGLVNYIGQAEELEIEYMKLLKQIEENSPQSMKLTKSLFSDELLHPLMDKISHVSNINAQSRQTPDFAEGVSAFLEKRKPNWKS